MPAVKEFRLPDLGEGLTESELVSWRVSPGDTIEMNQVIAEVETAKALVELPSPFAGVISSLHVEAGSTVQVGAPIMSVQVEDGSEADEPGARDVAPKRNPVLVGYGAPVEGGDAPRRRKRAAALPGPALPGPTLPGPVEGSTLAAGTERPRSTPPVRKLAHDLGVDLGSIDGTGPEGLITRADVERQAGRGGQPPLPAVPGEETRIPIKGVRKQTAAAMVSSAFTAPHAAALLTVDVTPTMELIASLKADRAFTGHRIGLLAVVAKAVCIAARRIPEVNSRWDEPAGEIVQFGYVNLGIAVATPRGLIVPNIPDAGALELAGLADAITSLADTAREGKTTPGRLAGGTMTITNVGVFGVDAGIPILNPGEAVILGMGAVRRMPWEYRGEIALRQVMTLSLAFDHRLVDGEQASRFLADVGGILAQPGRALTMV